MSLVIEKDLDTLKLSITCPKCGSIYDNNMYEHNTSLIVCNVCNTIFPEIPKLVRSIPNYISSNVAPGYSTHITKIRMERKLEMLDYHINLNDSVAQ